MVRTGAVLCEAALLSVANLNVTTHDDCYALNCDLGDYGGYPVELAIKDATPKKQEDYTSLLTCCFDNTATTYT